MLRTILTFASVASAFSQVVPVFTSFDTVEQSQGGSQYPTVTAHGSTFFFCVSVDVVLQKYLNSQWEIRALTRE